MDYTVLMFSMLLVLFCSFLSSNMMLCIFVRALFCFDCNRCLEVHMATLRVFYDKWVASAGVEEEGGDESDQEKK